MDSPYNRCDVYRYIQSSRVTTLIPKIPKMAGVLGTFFTYVLYAPVFRRNIQNKTRNIIGVVVVVVVAVFIRHCLLCTKPTL
jgi:hypothetical protein